MQRLQIRDRRREIYRVVVSLHNRPIEKYFYSLSIGWALTDHALALLVSPLGRFLLAVASVNLSLAALELVVITILLERVDANRAVVIDDFLLVLNLLEEVD